jgi:magnesium chelatase subunit D
MSEYADDTLAMTEEIKEAKALLPKVTVAPDAAELALRAVMQLNIASSRAEIFTLEAARAHAAADGRALAEQEDVRAVATMTLRQRSSEFMQAYFQHSQEEDERIQQTTGSL